jgi:2-octaprenyl-6-methoxyphenol hydroxylase
MSGCYDVAIVGGGMVGATLAVALSPLGLRIAVIEATAHDAADQPSFDERTTALSNGSRRILETLRIWPEVASAATPIAKIHVSDQGQFGFARIDASEQGLAAMGYVLPNRVLGSALWSRIAAETALHTYCPSEVLRVTPGEDEVGIALRGSDGAEVALTARLIVAADGVHSAVRDAFGIDSERRDYGQTALITTVLPKKFHDHVAYERFTGSGPLALLPLADGRCTLVLTLDAADVPSAITWSDEEFLREVQRRFGFRLGRFLQVGRRLTYPLALTQAAETSAHRCVVVGNAAQGLHPVAGMGFNLGLRDVASLAELLAERVATADAGAEPAGGVPAGGVDTGAAQLLAAYDAWRAADRRAIIRFTDGLVRVFSTRLRVVRHLRNLALLVFDQLPAAKTALSQLSTGAGGRIPKLARGVPLATAAARPDRSPSVTP